MQSTTALSARLRALPAPVLGAFLMIGASACFAAMNGLIRVVAVELEPVQIAFLRNLFALLFTLPWLTRCGVRGLRTKRLHLHLWRGVVGLSAMLFWFTSVANLPLSEAVALNFTVPLFATAAAAIFLGEVVRARRWTATAIGFLGVLIILRPGFVELTPMMGLPIAAAAFMAASVTLVKMLSRTESSITIVMFMNLVLTPLSFLPALFAWRWPSAEIWLAAAGIGFLATLAHIMLTRAYGMADASAIIPFDYMRLPFVALIAYFAFGEVANSWTWIGAAVIAGSSIYIAWREVAAAREGRASGAAGESVRARP